MVRKGGAPSVTMLPVTIPVYIFPRGGTEARPRGLTDGSLLASTWTYVAEATFVRPLIRSCGGDAHLPTRPARDAAARPPIFRCRAASRCGDAWVPLIFRSLWLRDAAAPGYHSSSDAGVLRDAAAREYPDCREHMLACVRTHAAHLP